MDPKRLAAAAFPELIGWTFEDCLYGEYLVYDGRQSSRRFYITFDMFGESESWRGYLTLDRPALHPEAVHLVNTAPCASLSAAIDALKREIGGVLAIFTQP